MSFYVPPRRLVLALFVLFLAIATATSVHATPPSKYRRIRWVADALKHHGFR